MVSEKEREKKVRARKRHDYVSKYVEEKEKILFNHKIFNSCAGTDNLINVKNVSMTR